VTFSDNPIADLAYPTDDIDAVMREVNRLHREWKTPVYGDPYVLTDFTVKRGESTGFNDEEELKIWLESKLSQAFHPPWKTKVVKVWGNYNGQVIVEVNEVWAGAAMSKNPSSDNPSASPVNGAYLPDAFFFMPMGEWKPAQIREGKKVLTWMWHPSTGLMTGNGFMTHGDVRNNYGVSWEVYDHSSKGRVSANGKICAIYGTQAELFESPRLDALLSLYNLEWINGETEIHTSSDFKTTLMQEVLNHIPTEEPAGFALNPSREVAYNRHAYMLPEGDVNTAWILSSGMDTLLAHTQRPADGMWVVPSATRAMSKGKTKLWALGDIQFESPGLRGVHLAVVKKANAVPGFYSPTRHVVVMNLTLDLVRHPAWFFAYLLHELIHANEYGLTGTEYVIGSEYKQARGWEDRPSYPAPETDAEYFESETEFNAYSLGYTHLLVRVMSALREAAPDVFNYLLKVYETAASKPGIDRVSTVDAELFKQIRQLGDATLTDMANGMLQLMDSLSRQYAKVADLDRRFRERVFYALQDLEA
jgi:hypothetical protein